MPPGLLFASSSDEEDGVFAAAPFLAAATAADSQTPHPILVDGSGATNGGEPHLHVVGMSAGEQAAAELANVLVQLDSLQAASNGPGQEMRETLQRLRPVRTH